MPFVLCVIYAAPKEKGRANQHQDKTKNRSYLAACSKNTSRNLQYEADANTDDRFRFFVRQHGDVDCGLMPPNRQVSGSCVRMLVGILLCSECDGLPPVVKPGFCRIHRGFCRRQGVSATAGGGTRSTVSQTKSSTKRGAGAQIEPELTNAKSILPGVTCGTRGSVFIQSCYPVNCLRGGSGTRWNASLPGKYHRCRKFMSKRSRLARAEPQNG